jgi:hypothetical protein
MKRGRELVVLIFVIIFMLTISCSAPLSSNPPGLSNQITPSISIPSPQVSETITAAPKTTTPPPRSLKVAAVTDKPAYLPGEQVKIILSVTNITCDMLTLGNWPPFTEIKLQGVPFKTVSPGSQQVELAPEETRNYTLDWDQLDSTGKQAHPAIYTVSAEFRSITPSSLPLTHGEGYHEMGPVIINFPQGFLQKTLELNQSQTVDGVTLNLNRVKISDNGIDISMLKTPVPPLTIANEPPDLRGQAEIKGTYRIDSGENINISYFGYLVVENGVTYEAHCLNPVPSDAGVLYFSITSLSLRKGGTYGPFEFEVPLR